MQSVKRETRLLLDEKGRIPRPLWSTGDSFVYNKETIRNFRRRKEWELYQVFNAHFVLRVIYGHVSYAGMARATYTDFDTGNSWTSGPLQVFPGDSFDLDFFGGQAHSLKYEDERYFFSLDFDGARRHFVCRSDVLDADLTFPEEGDALTVATPLMRKRQFFSCYIRNFNAPQGHIRIRGTDALLDGETCALLSSVRCVLPYRSGWIWGNGTGTVGGRTLGIQFGRGNAPCEHLDANTLLCEGNAQKIGPIRETHDPDDLMRPWQFASEDGKFEGIFEPSYVWYDHLGAMPVETRSHRVFGRLHGSVSLVDGERVRIEGMSFFCELGVHHW